MAYRCKFTKDERGRTIVSLMRGEERLSRLAIWHMPMRIGSASVLMGGIAGVATPEAHRHKGYASVVMEDAVERMREKRFDVSMLYGIPNFYHRWGFITTMSRSKFTMPTRDAEACAATCRARKFRSADLAAAMRMFNENNAGRSGTLVRDKRWIPWRKGQWWGVKPTIISYVRRGRVVGVAAFDLKADEVTCADVAVADASVFAGIVRHAAEMAVARRVERIGFCVPPDSAFADFLREQGGELSVGFQRDAGPMARIINQEQCLRKISGELTRRMRDSALADWSGSIRIATDLGTTRLVVARGRVKVGDRAGRSKVTLRLPQDRLTQLLFGFHSIGFMLSHGYAKLSGGKTLADKPPVAHRIVDTLFPKGTPCSTPSDTF